MRKSIIFNISGLLIIIFWIFILVELAKRVNFKSTPINTHRIYGQRNVEDYSEDWMDILLKGHKIGYAVTKIKKIHSGFEVSEKIFVVINLMGSTRKIISHTTAQINEKFLLNEFEYSLSPDSIEFKISGKMKGNNLYLSFGTGKDREDRLIKLSSKPMIGAGLTNFFRSSTLEVNKSYTIDVFDPLTMTTNPYTIRAVKREIVRIGDKSYDALRLEMTYLGTPLVFWLDRGGTPLKEQGFMGFTLVKSTPEKARAGLDRLEKIDFYDLSAIRVKNKIQGPRDLSYLKVQFDQTPSSLPREGLRQKLHGKILEIYKERITDKASYDIPYNGNNTELLYNLRPEILIQSGDPDIKKLSKKIVKKVINPEIATRMIMGWVFESLKKTPVASVPDAKKILASKRGDCNEHATLLTALLRAVGIPSRIVIGLVYNNGKFYYHAWNEVYTNGWITVDAIFKQMPVDATHIKLITGGIEKQIQIAGMINSVKFKVLDYR